MNESDIRNTKAGHHHHTHGTTTHGAHSGEINSDAAPAESAVKKHDHHDEKITEPKERKDTMKDKIAPTLTALALACIIGLSSAIDANAITIKADTIDDGATIQNAIGKIDIGIDAGIIDAGITKEEITGKININDIARIDGNDIIDAPASADIAIDYINS